MSYRDTIISLIETVEATIKQISNFTCLVDFLRRFSRYRDTYLRAPVHRRDRYWFRKRNLTATLFSVRNDTCRSKYATFIVAYRSVTYLAID